MTGVKWIKLCIDVFDNRKIKQIETLPDGDSIIVIWFKILCLAGKINEDGLMIITKDIPYTDEMLANEFKRPLSIIRLALNVFEKFGMIEIINDIYCVSNWEHYQNIEGMEKIREQTRKRVQKHREKKRLAQCNVTVTQGNATDIDIEEDIDIDNINKYIVEIINYLNDVLGSNYKSTTKATRSKINARLKEGFTVDDFKSVIDFKNQEWKNDKEMSKYLRPETLFGTKFESYLQNSKRGENNGRETGKYSGLDLSKNLYQQPTEQYELDDEGLL